MKIQYVLINFGKTFLKDPVEDGDPITNVIVDGVLREICILENLEMPNLDQEKVLEDGIELTEEQTKLLEEDNEEDTDEDNEDEFEVDENKND